MSETDTSALLAPDATSDAPTQAPEAKRSARRAGGRERRDPKAKVYGPAYITRAIPTYDVMGEENLQKIEATAERILCEIGRSYDVPGGCEIIVAQAKIAEQFDLLQHALFQSRG